MSTASFKQSMALGFFLLTTLGVFCGCGNHQTGHAEGAAQTLKVGIVPFEDVHKIEENYQPLAQYLGSKTGKSGEVFVTPEYAGILQALRADQIDCAYLSPLAYVLAAQQFQGTPEHLIPIAMPIYHGKPTYRGSIIVRADSPIHSVQDLRGKTFAFGDRTSASGYLYPAGMMRDAGIDPDKDIKAENVSFPGNVLAVLNHQVDAAATYEDGIQLALHDHPDQQKQLRVIAMTDDIPNGMFVARGNLDGATVRKLTQAMLTIGKDPQGQAALKKMQYDNWAPEDDHFFDSVRKKATVLGLNLQSLDAQKNK